MSGWRRYLPFVPSIAMGLVGVAWIAVGPASFGELFAADRPAWIGVVATAALTGALLGAAWILERSLPSFRHAGRLMERLLARLDLGIPAVLALATLTAASEEILFRGALLDAFGLWPQAVLFGLLHPASRRGWSYPLFAFAAGVGLGWLALFTGTLWAPLAAHFAINLQGLLEARASGLRSRRSRRATTTPDR